MSFSFCFRSPSARPYTNDPRLLDSAKADQRSPGVVVSACLRSPTAHQSGSVEGGGLNELLESSALLL